MTPLPITNLIAIVVVVLFGAFLVWLMFRETPADRERKERMLRYLDSEPYWYKYEKETEKRTEPADEEEA